MASKMPKKVKSKASDADANKLIRENMKCPVCMEVLLSPIYQCETGHNICYLCVDEVTECPLCKGDYGDTRNYFAEELVNSMSFPCKFEDYGCTKILPGSELKEHQDFCEFQPYRCPELACQELAGLHQMAKHLDRHGFKIMKGDVQEASIDIQDDHFDRKTEYNPWRISAFNREFYTVSTRQKDGSWYFWSYCLGLAKDTKKFSYEILVFSDDKQVLYRGLVHSLRVEPEDIMDHGNCLTLTDSVIKSLRKNGKITCRVRFIQGRNWDPKAEKPKKPALAAKASKTNPMFKGKMRIPSAPSLSASPSCSSSLFNPYAPALPTAKPKSTCNPNRLPLPPMSPLALKRELSSQQQVNTVNGKDLKDVPLSASSSRNLKKPPTGSVTHVLTKITDEEHSFVTKMRETLRCPGCNETISPPVHQCAIGHNICYSCKLARPDCAVCRAPIGTTRNFFAEELLYKVYQRCSHAGKGCKVVLPSSQMRSHEGSCEFAPFDCPFNACRKQVGPNELFDHLKSHQIAVVQKELKTELEVPKALPTAPICGIPKIITCHNSNFYPLVVRDADGSWNFSVSTQDHHKFRYEVTLTKMSKTLSFQGPAISIRANQTQVMQGGLSLIVPENMIKSLKYDGHLKTSVRIFKSDNIPADSVFAFHSCLKQGSKAVELFANKKTSVSPEEEDEEDAAGLVSTEGSETQLSDPYDDDSDVDVEVRQRKTGYEVPEKHIQFQAPYDEDNLSEEIPSDLEWALENEAGMTMTTDDPSDDLWIPRKTNAKKVSLDTATSANTNKKQKQSGAARKRSRSRSKLQCNASTEVTSKPTSGSVVGDSLAKEGHEDAGVPDEKSPTVNKALSVRSVGVGDNCVNSYVNSTQTSASTQESCQVGTSLTSIVLTPVVDALVSDEDLPSLLSSKNLDKVVEILSDGVNDIYDIAEVITDGCNAVKSVVDIDVITDGLNAVKNVVEMVGTHIMSADGDEAKETVEIEFETESQVSLDPEVD